MIKLKNRAVALSIAGAMLFTTAAAADLLSGDAYSGAKAVVKNTARFLTAEADSFTMDFGMAIKIDSETAEANLVNEKFDMKNWRTESIRHNIDKDGEHEFYTYEDEDIFVSSHIGTGDGTDDEVYYISPYGYSKEYPMISNPFDDETAADLETVFDAFVGNMKEFVRTGEEDGMTVYYGSLDSSQIPTLPNALCSFVAKYSFNDDYSRDYYGMPKLSDIFLDNVEGSLRTTDDDIITHAAASASLTGTDEDGEEHSIVLELYLDITDINETDIPVFDRSGKNVEEHYYEETVEGFGSDVLFEECDLGEYKKVLVKKADDAYKVTGEVTVSLNTVESELITGTYKNTETGKETEFTAELSDSGDYISDNESVRLIIQKNVDFETGVTESITVYDEDVEIGEDCWSASGMGRELLREF